MSRCNQAAVERDLAAATAATAAEQHATYTGNATSENEACNRSYGKRLGAMLIELAAPV